MPRPASLSWEPTLTDLGSASPLPRHFARNCARRERGRVRGWRAEEVAELDCYVRWAGPKRGKRRPGTHPFWDLVHRLGRPQDRGPQSVEDRWRRMLGEAVPGMDLHDPRERRRRQRMQMLRELLQRVGKY